MHGQNVEFGNLIPGKCCFWKEIFAILRGNLSFRWIFFIFFLKNSENWQKCNIFSKVWTIFQGNGAIFSPQLWGPMFQQNNPHLVFVFLLVWFLWFMMTMMTTAGFLLLVMTTTIHFILVFIFLAGGRLVLFFTWLCGCLLCSWWWHFFTLW